ncbi:uncharacterized protein L201_006232 [Kwoniella dendrophila CBS 6074]|uniref:FAD dependent oxidoreductase domain-containing protein n=1 Tax=Kwoniella dendrophila CBS 6074 TaxID=1295534 RepID=A0AAX4K1M7_9TREE
MSSATSDGRLPPVGQEHSSTSQVQLDGEITGRPIERGMSTSHWLGTVRSNPLLDYRSSEELPSKADMIIIGSGLSGALTALSLLESSNPPKSLVMLEARELCSGAIGRNAGHCKPDIWRGFTEYSKLFGNKEALRILTNEGETRDALVEFIESNEIQCEIWNGKTMDMMMDEETANKAAENMKAFLAAGGDARQVDITLNPVQAEKLSRVKGAKAIYASPASTLHPWKLVEFIIKRCLKLGLQLHTLTPVLSVDGSDNDWTIQTKRGTIKTPTVIHTTNAYAAALLPEMKKTIIPIPHMCNLVYPPSSHSGSKSLKTSYAVIYKEGLYTINPRLNADGCILVGGVQPNQHHLEAYIEEKKESRQFDDSLKDFKPITDSVKDLGTNGFEWNESQNLKTGFSVRYDRSWSGIIGLTKDQVPLVGAVPGKSGQWTSCGHNGHGMARIFTCSRGLAQLIQGAEWTKTGLPKCFEITQQRLNGELYRQNKL